jgi:DNA-binding Lrp family transcriptional regulator
MLQDVRAIQEMPFSTAFSHYPIQQNDNFHSHLKQASKLRLKPKAASGFESAAFLGLSENRQLTLKEIFNVVLDRSNLRQAEDWLEQQLKTPDKIALPWTKQSDTENTTYNYKKEAKAPPLPSPIKQPIKKISYTKASSTAPLPKEEIPKTSERALAITERVKELNPKETFIFQKLVETALVVAEARDYSPYTSHVTFFCPAEIVANALGIHRTTLWRKLKKLTSLGLVDCQDFKTTLNGKTVNAGKLWRIKLNPNEGTPAKLDYHEFKHAWRDLEADIKTGKTAYNALHPTTQQSENLLKGKNEVEQILTYALPNRPSSSPLLTVAGLEIVLDLRTANKNERNKMVDVAARTVAHTLQDTWVNFHRKTLWNLLRQYDLGVDYFLPYYELVQRTKGEVREGYAKRGGALLKVRLKEWGAWEAIERTPRNKVGAKSKATN